MAEQSAADSMLAAGGPAASAADFESQQELVQEENPTELEHQDVFRWWPACQSLWTWWLLCLVAGFDVASTSIGLALILVSCLLFVAAIYGRDLQLWRVSFIRHVSLPNTVSELPKSVREIRQFSKTWVAKHVLVLASSLGSTCFASFKLAHHHSDERDALATYLLIASLAAGAISAFSIFDDRFRIDCCWLRAVRLGDLNFRSVTLIKTIMVLLKMQLLYSEYNVLLCKKPPICSQCSDSPLPDCTTTLSSGGIESCPAWDSHGDCSPSAYCTWRHDYGQFPVPIAAYSDFSDCNAAAEVRCRTKFGGSFENSICHISWQTMRWGQRASVGGLLMLMLASVIAVLATTWTQARNARGAVLESYVRCPECFIFSYRILVCTPPLSVFLLALIVVSGQRPDEFDNDFIATVLISAASVKLVALEAARFLESCAGPSGLRYTEPPSTTAMLVALAPITCFNAHLLHRYWYFGEGDLVWVYTKAASRLQIGIALLWVLIFRSQIPGSRSQLLSMLTLLASAAFLYAAVALSI